MACMAPMRLEAQLDLVYAFCQLELARRHPGHAMSRSTAASIAWPTMKCWSKASGGRHVMLLNNLNSFTCSRERACEFGDYILAVEVPLTKIFFHCGLMPGVLQGEDEFLVWRGWRRRCQGGVRLCRQCDDIKCNNSTHASRYP
jgi:NAD+--dinitrogen-reductase ADP-D-ribosyltransferase